MTLLRLKFSKRIIVSRGEAHAEARDAIGRVVKATFAELIMRVHPPISVGICHIGLARRLRRRRFVHVPLCGRECSRVCVPACVLGMVLRATRGGDVGRKGMRDEAKTCANTIAGTLGGVCLLRRGCGHRETSSEVGHGLEVTHARERARYEGLAGRKGASE